MADSDGGVLFPPRAQDPRVAELLTNLGITQGSLGIDEEFKLALGTDLGLTEAKIKHLTPNDMYHLWLRTNGLEGQNQEPFDEPFKFDGWPALTQFTYDQNFEFNQLSMVGLTINDDGTRLYGASDDAATSRFIRTDPPWSVGFTPEDEIAPDIVLSRGSDRIREMSFSNDGTKVFAAVFGDDTIEEIANAGAAFNPASGDLAVVTDTFTPTPVEPRSVDISPDGTKIWYVSNTSGRDIFEINLSTPNDLTSAVMGNSFAPAEGDMLCMKFAPDGSKFFTLGLDLVLYEYSVDTDFDISDNPTLQNSLNVNANAPTGAASVGFDLSPTGNHLYVVYRHTSLASNNEIGHYTSPGV